MGIAPGLKSGLASNREMFGVPGSVNSVFWPVLDIGMSYIRCGRARSGREHAMSDNL